MGICPMDPEVRIINDRNDDLLQSVKNHLEQLKTYGFAEHLLRQVQNIQIRYLYNSGILQDLQKLEKYLTSSILKRSQLSITENLQEEVKGSCLILQNEAGLIDDKGNQNIEDPTDSFQNNMRDNKSLVVQINIIYRRDINRQQYSQSLKLFLKWAQMFQEHSYGGFLKPLYSNFCNFVYGLPKQDFSTIVDQISIFVQFMVTIITEVYGLQQLASSEGGKLIKNENIYNLIMGIIFKRTKLKKFLLKCINFNESNKISLFQNQLIRYHKRPTYFFGISKKFTLQDTSLTESEINKSIEQKQYIQPYSQSLKLVNQLCKNGTPITKLKTIINISKQIITEIQKYYQSLSKEAPDLDPDNLASIVIYLLVKNGSKNIYEELKIVQYFTTANCLNCISGYYLNVFIASIQSILTLQEPN